MRITINDIAWVVTLILSARQSGTDVVRWKTGRTVSEH